MIRGNREFFSALMALLLLLGAHSATAALGDHSWSKGYSVSGKADVDAAGNMICAGGFFGSVDFGGGPMNAVNFFNGDVYLARFDAAGNHLWSTSFSPTDFGSRIDAIASAPDGSFYLAGFIYGGVVDFGGSPLAGPNQTFLAKFDAAGNHRWSATHGNGQIKDLSASNTQVAIGGAITISLDFGGGALAVTGLRSAFVARLSSAGAHEWSNAYGDTANQETAGVAIDVAGNIVASIAMGGSADFGGGVLSANGLNVALARFGASGAHEWSQIFDGSFSGGSLVVMGLDMDASGNLAIAGELHSSVDFGGGTLTSVGGGDIYVASFDAAGNHVWSDAYGDTGFQGAQSLSLDGSGGVVISGSMSGSVDFGGGPVSGGGFSDVFAAAFDGTGSHVFSAAYGTANSDWECHNLVDGSGALYLVGGGSGGIDFGGGALAQATLFLVKLDGASATATAPARSDAILGYNRPNPFNPSTVIPLSLSREGAVSLTVVDARGRVVRELFAGSLPAGDHDFSWTGVDDAGQPVASGIYRVLMRGDDSTQSRAMLLVK